VGLHGKNLLIYAAVRYKLEQEKEWANECVPEQRLYEFPILIGLKLMGARITLKYTHYSNKLKI